MPTTADARVAAMQRRQHGVVSRWQVLEAGVTAAQVKQRLASGRWEACDYAVYREAATPVTWRQRLMAACLAGPAVASHRSAAALWAIAGFEERDVEVTALRHRRRHAHDVVWHESSHLSERDLTEIDGIPTTCAVRTLLDLAVVVDVDVLEEVYDEGARRGLLDRATVQRRWEQFGTVRPGHRRVKALLDRKIATDRPPDSILETRFRQLVRRAGLPEPVAQYEIRGPDGRFVARVDFAYPEHLLVVELEGEAYHSSRRVRQHDVQRLDEVVALGYRALRFTWDDVHRRPAWVATTLGSAMPLGA